MKIDVYHDLSSIEQVWRSFQQIAAGTFYQTFEWCSAWIDTAGRQEGVQARIVTGTDPVLGLTFLLPFAVRRHAGMNVLEWIGSSQINYGYGLYHKDFLPHAGHWFSTEGWGLIEKAGPIDVVRLRELPDFQHGHPHPFASWISLTGANRSYAMSLGNDFEEIYARKRSGETRRGNRKRDAKLEKVGQVTFGLPADCNDAHRLLELMFQHQASRLAESGIRGVFTPAERQFVHRLADTGDVLLPYHLTINGDMAAMMLGGCYNNTYWALISSLNGGAYRRYSPGDAALRRTIQACCEKGLDRFDFSSGDAPYKQPWADETMQLQESIHAVTLKGFPLAFAYLVSAYAKRVIKRSTVLWPLFSNLRTILRGEQLGSPGKEDH